MSFPISSIVITLTRLKVDTNKAVINKLIAKVTVISTKVEGYSRIETEAAIRLTPYEARLYIQN